MGLLQRLQVARLGTPTNAGMLAIWFCEIPAHRQPAATSPIPSLSLRCFGRRGPVVRVYVAVRIYRIAFDRLV